MVVNQASLEQQAKGVKLCGLGEVVLHVVCMGMLFYPYACL